MLFDNGWGMKNRKMHQQIWITENEFHKHYKKNKKVLDIFAKVCYIISGIKVSAKNITQEMR